MPFLFPTIPLFTLGAASVIASDTALYRTSSAADALKTNSARRSAAERAADACRSLSLCFATSRKFASLSLPSPPERCCWSAKLHERDVPARQFDFERTTVAGCSEQNGLLLEERTGLAVLQDALDDKAGLLGLVADGDELRLGSGRPLRPEVLGKTLLGETDNAVGGGENCLRRAIISVERDDACGRRKLL